MIENARLEFRLKKYTFYDIRNGCVARLCPPLLRFRCCDDQPYQRTSLLSGCLASRSGYIGFYPLGLETVI
jgi:hypothetical protein